MRSNSWRRIGCVFLYFPVLFTGEHNSVDVGICYLHDIHACIYMRIHVNAPRFLVPFVHIYAQYLYKTICVFLYSTNIHV